MAVRSHAEHGTNDVASGGFCTKSLVRISDGGLDGRVAVAGTAGVATAGGIAVSTQTSQAGPIVAGVVAVVVALVTWYATDKRQATALAAEQQRHEATLAAERERLTTQLEHERQLSDVADLRQVIEALLRSANDLSRALTQQMVEDPTTPATVMRVQEEMMTHLRAVQTLTIRLPLEHPILVAARDGFVSMGRAKDASQAHERAAFQQHNSEYLAKQRALLDAAVPLLGSRVG